MGSVMDCRYWTCPHCCTCWDWDKDADIIKAHDVTACDEHQRKRRRAEAGLSLETNPPREPNWQPVASAGKGGS